VRQFPLASCLFGHEYGRRNRGAQPHLAHGFSLRGKSGVNLKNNRKFGREEGSAKYPVDVREFDECSFEGRRGLFRCGCGDRSDAGVGVGAPGKCSQDRDSLPRREGGARGGSWVEERSLVGRSERGLRGREQ
jgi:hypothetical protein